MEKVQSKENQKLNKHAICYSMQMAWNSIK